MVKQEQQSEGGIVAQLFPLISSVKELSWENLVESHQRWSEEVIAICSLAGNGVYAALDSNAAYGRILDATFNDEIQNDGLYPYENGIGGTTAAPAASVTGSAPTVTAKSTPATDHDTVTDKGRQSTSTAGILSNKLFGGGSADKASPSRTTTMKKKTESKDKDNAKKRPIYTEQDDRIARAIIVLTMKRDLRQRFAKLMKAAVTARQLFNGLAIMKEAVNEGAAYEEDPGATIPEPQLLTIRSKAQAMAEEMDWSSPMMSERKFLFFRITKHE